MQQRIVDGFLQGLLDPRFQGLITEFYSLRSRLEVNPTGKLMERIRTMLQTFCTVLEDQFSLHEMRAAVGDSTGPVLPDIDVPEVVSCIHGVEEIVSGPAFADAATVLFIFCQKLGLGTIKLADMVPKDVLQRLEEFLAVLGLRELSIVQLWDNATGELREQRDEMFAAIMEVLQAVLDDCVLA